MHKQFLLVMILLLLVFSSASAIYLNDFLVNTENRREIDEFPFVLVDSSGNFSVIWTKYCYDPNLNPPYASYTCGRVYLKRYNSIGNVLVPAIPLTPDTMMALDPVSVAMHPSGAFVLAWTDYSNWTPPYWPTHIYFQRFNSAVIPLGEPVRIDQNPMDSAAFVKDIGIDNRGNFVIVWRESLGDTLFARRYSSDGTSLGPTFSPDDCGALECSEPMDPKIAIHPDGHFLLVWNDNIVEYNTFAPTGRLYDTAGTSVWPEARVLTCDDSEFVPHCGGNLSNCLSGNWTDADMMESGDFLLATNACDGEPNNNNVYGRLFDQNANPLSHNFKINTVNPNTYYLYPRVHWKAGAGFFVIWSDCRYTYNEGPLDIYVQRFDSLANPVGANWRINTPRGSAKYDLVSFDLAISNDRVFIAWTDYRDWKDYPNYSDTIETNIYGQLVDVSQIGFYIPGDANFDGGISLADVIHLVNYIFKHATPPDPELWIGDVNGDCKVSLVDVIYLVNYIFKPGWQPPVKGCVQ